MQRIIINKALFGLSLAASVAIVSNMILIPTFKNYVLTKRMPITIVEVFLLFCFSIVFSFNVLCFYWGCRKRKENSDSIFTTFLLMASLFCIIMIFGQKTMLDELSQQYQLHNESIAEWVILYVLFTLQLIFNTIISFTLKRKLRAAL